VRQAGTFGRADGSHGELLGLGRSIYTVFDRALIEHALERLQQASRELGETERAGNSSARRSSSPPRRAGRLLRAHMSPVLGGDGQHHAQVGGLSITGFVLVLDDVTSTNERHARRDALIQSLIEGGRGPLGSIRAAAEMLSEVADMPAQQRDRFLRVVHDEAAKLSAQFETAASAFSNDLRERWLLEEMRGAEVLIVAARRIGERRADERRALAVKTENVDEDLWLRVDGYGLFQALRYLAWRLQDEYAVREVRLSLTRSAQLAQLDLSWLGTFMNNETAMSWLQDAMSVAGDSSPLSVTDIVERCNGEIWFQRERVSHRAFFRTMLPIADAPTDLPRAVIAAAEGERPEFYDFDLFSWSAASHELDDRLLSELAYTVFDTETTGLQPTQGDEIIQIGATRIVNRRLLRHECFDQLINPQCRLSPQSIEVHGITPDFSSTSRRSMSCCRNSMLSAPIPYSSGTMPPSTCASCSSRKSRPVCVSNSRFSIPCCCRRFCTATRRRTGWRRSPNASGCRYFGRHTALGDAIVTGEVFLKMLPLLAEMGIRTLRQAREASQKTFHARLRY
jgi:DNA polymerase-3 subunit epsilon